MAALVLFFRLMVRPAVRERPRSLLVIAAVALGVSVVLAIELAGKAAAGSFRSSLETISGDNNLEVTAAGRVPEQIVGTLEMLPFPLRVSPRIEGNATLVSTGETIPLIGIDMVAEAVNQQRGDVAAAGGKVVFNHINDSDAIWVSRSLAARIGERLALLIKDETGDYTVRGFIPDSAKSGGEAILMDIGAAQLASGKAGRPSSRVMNGVLPDLPLARTTGNRSRLPLWIGTSTR